MDTANEKQVVELKNTDSSLRTKLSTVEKEIHEIGSGIVFRNEFMKKFQYWISGTQKKQFVNILLVNIS